MPGRPPSTSPAVLILGAGPAGLALAFALQQRGLDCRLLEKGSAVAHSWATMPTHLKLVSPWQANVLPGSDARRFPSNYEMPRAEYGAVLQEYARLHKLSVVTNAEVHDVTHCVSGGFTVRTSAGTFTAPLLVNATGCFAHPFFPDFPGARASSLPQFHVATYRDAGHLRAAIGQPGGLVLIVGGRLSAGQAMVELVEAGFHVALSHRSPIQFGAGPFGSWIFFRIHPALERLKLRLHGNAARGFPSVMPGGRARRLIESGRVQTFPDIARFEERRVTFHDGQSLQPEAVLYATGFRPALAHLAALDLALDDRTGCPARRGFESAAVPGLFFLGLDHLRNFRSRFIRGIREDAPLLAEELAARLRARTAEAPGPAAPFAAAERPPSAPVA